MIFIENIRDYKSKCLVFLSLTIAGSTVNAFILIISSSSFQTEK